jgi:hypothetical protein
MNGIGGWILAVIFQSDPILHDKLVRLGNTHAVGENDDLALYIRN